MEPAARAPALRIRVSHAHEDADDRAYDEEQERCERLEQRRTLPGSLSGMVRAGRESVKRPPDARCESHPASGAVSPVRAYEAGQVGDAASAAYLRLLGA